MTSFSRTWIKLGAAWDYQLIHVHAELEFYLNTFISENSVTTVTIDPDDLDVDTRFSGVSVVQVPAEKNWRRSLVCALLGHNQKSYLFF
jgi:hypothetical protein